MLLDWVGRLFTREAISEIVRFTVSPASSRRRSGSLLLSSPSGLGKYARIKSWKSCWWKQLYFKPLLFSFGLEGHLSSGITHHSCSWRCSWWGGSDGSKAPGPHPPSQPTPPDAGGLWVWRRWPVYFGGSRHLGGRGRTKQKRQRVHSTVFRGSCPVDTAPQTLFYWPSAVGLGYPDAINRLLVDYCGFSHLCWFLTHSKNAAHVPSHWLTSLERTESVGWWDWLSHSVTAVTGDTADTLFSNSLL